MGTEKDKISILLIDDDEDEYILTRDLLAESDALGFSLDWESDYNQGLAAIKENNHDVVLVDYRMGERNGLELMEKALQAGCQAPLILLTGQGDREVDMLAMKAGAADYLEKKNLTAALLERSLRYAIEKSLLINELKGALERIKALKGLVPICAHCKKIRDDKGYWNNLEVYIEAHSDAEFSHGLCPECMKELYPDLMEEKEGE